MHKLLSYKCINYSHTNRQGIHFYSTENRKYHNMKVFVEKTSLNVENEVKMTKTSKFLGLLIKSCILPINVSANKVIFNFFSAKMLFHILGIFFIAFVCVSYGFILFPAEFIKMFEKVLEHQRSWIEDLSSVLGGFGPLLLTFLPSVLGHGLKNMDPKFVQNPAMKCPKIAWLNVAGMKGPLILIGRKLYNSIPLQIFLQHGFFLILVCFLRLWPI